MERTSMNPKRWLAVLALALAVPAGADTIQGVLVDPPNPTTHDRIKLTVVGVHNPYCPIVWEPPPPVKDRTIRLSASYPDCVTPPHVQEEFRQTFVIDPLPAPGTYYILFGFGGLPYGDKYEVLEVSAPERAPLPFLGTGDDLFQVLVEWKNPRDGSEGEGYGLPLAEDSGAFWFFNPANVEATIKILDGRPVNGHWWVFIASMTDLEMKVTIYENRNGCFLLPVFPPECPSKTYLQTAGQNRNFIDVNFSAE